MASRGLDFIDVSGILGNDDCDGWGQERQKDMQGTVFLLMK